ncbi:MULTISPECIES: selenium-binding family protein [Metallosphaera]|uniref:Selenium-binding protein n=3 Tax=Metallosphaera TaxID=41980 RepID=A4YFD5_METS5|nr:MULTISPECIES: selenium-binding family protein [Metallosphaera]ABP95137.1 selenium-binding protein [Metallosphaera sedula DSM 5348]AIM27123.1 selenium-binding protein [Metallosphaera sedula]AKV74031.1 selenium-binding protein [Metallosphaera sedula]AKV76270.1 selenium-binding protein [Metallosphaera sedula]AKV78522.1 selenium-binding protein [Metallosphaera sedula]
MGILPPFRRDPTFYPSPRMAMNSPPEDLAYVASLYTGTGINRPDFLAVVDVNPKSETYSRIVGKVEMPNLNDELHHFGWNACSSSLCPNGRTDLERRFLIVPGLRSSRIHVIDTKDNPRQPKIVKVVEPSEVSKVTGYTRLHTVHCGPDGIYISAFGNEIGEGPGGILLLDHFTFEPLGKWEINRGDQYFAYDFWWNLPNEVMVTSEWAVPNTIEDGLRLEHLEKGYGNRIHFWDLRRRKRVSSITLGEENRMALELRPLHDPTKLMGFINMVVSLKDLSSSIWLWYFEDGKWNAEKVIEIPAEPGEGLPEIIKQFKVVPPLVTDIDLSLDDKFLYVSMWGIGEVRQYDVSDPFRPRLAGKVRLGGILHRADHPSGFRLTGGPQMLEVSRDGRRIYVTNSLYSTWDNQFYPEGLKGWMVKINSSQDGGLEVDKEFLVDFGEARAHQVRLKGGDASSDSYCYS